ncbi:MAG TPA: 3-deoxy-7-phosphoheptulonate synthase [Phycisphaerae bacterium]|nr:3-deoxy-7-phosphoheptulonate synthase [Phycisphaerae bacterium]
MSPRSSREHVDHVVQLLDDMGVRSCVIDGASRSVIELLETNGQLDRTRLESAPMVERVLDQPAPILAMDRASGNGEVQPREIPLGSRGVMGGRRFSVIAGPCSVENEDRLIETARGVADAGAVALRGGVFKPRTSPYSFQGLEERGLEMLARAREKTGLAIVTEVMCCKHVEKVEPYADVLQVGSRNMHNTPLLKAVGEQTKPVLLKRGWSATLEEFLLAAEYVIHAGNPNVILCERGIRTHEEYVRNTLALAIVPEVKRISSLPIIVDPSHGTGRTHLITPMSRAAIACGADGLLVEVHTMPSRAWSDGDQTLDVGQFRDLMQNLKSLAHACDREL